MATLLIETYEQKTSAVGKVILAVAVSWTNGSTFFLRALGQQQKKQAKDETAIISKVVRWSFCANVLCALLVAFGEVSVL